MRRRTVYHPTFPSLAPQPRTGDTALGCLLACFALPLLPYLMRLIERYL